MEQVVDVTKFADGLTAMAEGATAGIKQLVGSNRCVPTPDVGGDSGVARSGKPAATSWWSAGVRDGTNTLARGATIVVGGGLACYAAWRYGPFLYRAWNRHYSNVTLSDAGKLTPSEEESLEDIRSCVRGTYDEDDFTEVVEGANAADANINDDGDEAEQPPPQHITNPYKGDSRRTRVVRSFWVALAQRARARFGPIRYTSANRDMVRSWCYREALALTARAQHPNGSIRHTHLAQWLPKVTAAVFVQSDADLALERVMALLEGCGRVRGDGAGW